VKQPLPREAVRIARHRLGPSPLWTRFAFRYAFVFFIQK
jgi:hypothetical protein